MSRKGKGEVATQCSKCRSVIMPTDEQLIRMDEKKLKDVKEESELRLWLFLFLLSLSDERRVAPKAGGEARSAQSGRRGA